MGGTIFIWSILLPERSKILSQAGNGLFAEWIAWIRSDVRSGFGLSGFIRIRIRIMSITDGVELRRVQSYLADGRGWNAFPVLFTGPNVLRRHMVACRSSAGSRIASCRGMGNSFANSNGPTGDAFAGDRLAGAGAVRFQGSRRGKRTSGA